MNTFCRFLLKFDFSLKISLVIYYFVILSLSLSIIYIFIYLSLCIFLSLSTPHFPPEQLVVNTIYTTESRCMFHMCPDPNGCYYNYDHYEEGDRIVTNEPCLNCTCHNRMLMCYLRVCPFSKAIGQDCTVQKSPDQCCPTISCPEGMRRLLQNERNVRTH